MSLAILAVFSLSPSWAAPVGALTPDQQALHVLSRLSDTFKNGQQSRQEFLISMQKEMAEADNGAPSASGFPSEAARLAGLIRQDPKIRIAFAGLGGWDTHIGQGGARGQLAGRLQALGSGLAALTRGLGRELENTVIVVMSEFGRTVRENGNGGTDHGHGNVMWVLGGPVAGGKIYGDWPSLAADRLFEGRDLAVTTDFRNVMAAVLEPHLRLDDQSLNGIFPAMPAIPSTIRSIIRA